MILYSYIIVLRASLLKLDGKNSLCTEIASLTCITCPLNFIISAGGLVYADIKVKKETFKDFGINKV